jgi:hypothetical protein
MPVDLVRAMFAAVQQNKSTLYFSCAVALVPAALHRVVLRLASGPMIVPARLVVKLAPGAVAAVRRALLVLAESAQALSAVLVAFEITRTVATAYVSRPLSSEMCRTQDHLASDALLGNPLVASRLMAALVVCIVALHVDRVLRLVDDREAQSLLAAIDCAVLIFLVCEQSPLAPVFAVHACLDSALARTSGVLVTIGKHDFSFAAGNLRALCGVVMSLALMLLGSFSFDAACRGQTMDAAIVIYVRLNTLLWDLVDVAKRARLASRRPAH